MKQVVIVVVTMVIRAGFTIIMKKIKSINLRIEPFELSSGRIELKLVVYRRDAPELNYVEVIEENHFEDLFSVLMKYAESAIRKHVEIEDDNSRPDK